MKIIKLSVAAIILACSFQAASAQVRIGVRVGPPPPRREVIVERYPRHREVIVERAPVRNVYYRNVYRRPVVVNRDYYRHERIERRRY